MRVSGWGGSLPANDDEAVARILAAGHQALETNGTQMTMTDVAKLLQVTRQTVYRYFPSTDALVRAVALDIGVRLASDLVDRTRGIHSPGAAMVELVAHTIELLRANTAIMVLLDTSVPNEVFNGSMTTSVSRQHARNIVEQLDVPWFEIGFDEYSLDEMVGWALLVVDAFVTGSGEPLQTGEALRKYLTTWLAPAVESMAIARMDTRTD